MAGVSAAWALSRPGWQEEFETITVLERSWRLGGKGASGRGEHGRIEEHGLHVWLGYYDNAFRLMREVYQELDRPRSDPAAPIATFEDAFVRSGRVGIAEPLGNDEWNPWMADFATDDAVPGEPDADASPLTLDRFVRRGLALLASFVSSLDGGPRADVRPAPGRRALTDTRHRAEWVTEMATTDLLRRFGGPVAVDRLRQSATSPPLADPRWRRSVPLVDLIATSLIGVWRDRLLDDPRGLAAANDEDFRAWMRRHGAAEDTLRSPLVNGLYDLVFGYRDGDPAQPAFAAGTGLMLSAKMFFEYRGSVFWKMTTGMGDAVFAPLYQALVARGVGFRFSTDVRALHLDDERRGIGAVTISTPVEPVGTDAPYQPLIRVKGLPCWPSAPRRTPPDVAPTTLVRGHDFDVLVFALPAGVVPDVCPELIDVSRRWRNVARHLGTVATQSAQLWLNEDERALRSSVADATMAGLGHPLDTYADMSQVLPSEDWPVDRQPRAVAYFCSAMKTDADRSPSEQVRADLADLLEQRIRHIWPGAMADDGSFRWSALVAPDGQEGPDRLDHQFWQANVDPSDRYVQSLPMSDRYRLAADESGLDGLVLAGDWTHNGLDAGCIEAAVRSAFQAANVVLGRPLDEGVAGFYLV